MAAPTFDLPVYGVSPNQYSTESALENNINNALSALWTEALRYGGRSFASRADAVAAGQSELPAIVGLVFTREGSTLVMRGPGQTADDPLFGTYPSWGVIARNDSVTAIRDAGIITLQSVGGTANAITADISTSLQSAGAVIGGQSIVELIPLTTNTNTTVTLSIGGDTPANIKTEDNSAPPAGSIVAGRSYLLRKRGTEWRMLAGAVAMVDATNTAKLYTSRADMLSAGQAFLQAKYSRALVVEDDVITLRGNGATDDQLFPTYPYWGVLYRYPQHDRRQLDAGFVVVTQTADSVIPARPPHRVVYWQCWDDPSAHMQEPDIWLELPAPGPLPVIDAAAWDLRPTGTLNQCAIRLNTVPNLVPPILDVQAKIDSGGWVTVGSTPGTYTLGGASGLPSNVSLRLRRAYGAAGAETATRTVSATAAPITVSDLFERADGVDLSTITSWAVTKGALTHASNAVRGTAFGGGDAPFGGYAMNNIAVHKDYFKDSQWAEISISAPGSNISFGAAILLQADHSLLGCGQGYLMRIHNNKVVVYRNIQGMWTMVRNMSHAVSIPDNTMIRAEYRSRGEITVGIVGGATLLQWTDKTGIALPVGGRPGISSSYSSGGEASALIYDFAAGSL